MTLTITLKPKQTLFVGRARITSLSNKSTMLGVDGDVPVLRPEFTIAEDEVVDDLTRLHLVLQEMYLAGRNHKHHGQYIELARNLLHQGPYTTDPLRQELEKLVSQGDIYAALRLVKQAEEARIAEENLSRNSA